MRHNIFIGFMVSIFLVLWIPTIVIAQTEETTAPNQLNVERDQLTIVGTKRGTLTRTLLLYTDSGPLKNVKVMPLDLERTDGDAVFSAQRIQENPPSPLDAVAANEPVRVSLTFNLGKKDGSEDLRSGEFKGKILFVYEGGKVWVPISVTVKDPMVLPIVVLLLGVVLGLVVTRYRAIGKPRDEVIVRIDALRKQMGSDQELAEAFRKRLSSEIIDVEAALQATQWDEARTEMTEAEGIWTHWRRGREDWILQFGYLEETLRPRLQDLDEQALIVQHARRQLDELGRKAPGLESPEQFRKELQNVTDLLNSFARLYDYLDQLNGLRGNLSGEPDAEEWQDKILDFRRQLRQLKPTDDPAVFQQLEDELVEAVKTLEERAPQRSMTKGKGLPGISEIRALLEPSPGTLQHGLLNQPSKAETRLQWFFYGTYVIAVLLLAWAGFEKLYVARSDFGVTPSSDYFPLLLWGFGAEATRASIIELIQGRDVSEVKGGE